jgi:dienelactone hydrolase
VKKRRFQKSIILLLSCVLSSMAFARSDSPRRELGRPSSSSSVLQGLEEVVFVPLASNPGIQLETTIYRPKGRGPFPLVVMNHGKAFIAPAKQVRARYPVLSQEFVRRGYVVVVPMRQGFSQSGGRQLSTGCDLAAVGREQAKDVDAVVKHFQKQAWINKDQVVVMGQSQGGLVTMAYAEHPANGVKLLVNFAGGLKSTGGRCKTQWAEDLVLAFEQFGAKAQLNSLWFYGQNDSFFNPSLVASMHSAYLNAGRHPKSFARLVAYGAFGQDAHGMVEYSGGVRLWWPTLEVELKRLGLPVTARRN